jgi:hypothetical protein
MPALQEFHDSTLYLIRAETAVCRGLALLNPCPYNQVVKIFLVYKVVRDNNLIHGDVQPENNYVR